MFKTKLGSLAISFSLLTLPVIPSFIAAADEIEEVVAVGTRASVKSGLDKQKESNQLVSIVTSQ